MSMSDEFERLAALRDRGVLSEDEFQRAKELVISQQGRAPLTAGSHDFRRSIDDKWLGGVCAGLARSTGVDSWVVRLVFASLFLFWGSGLILYLLLWIFVPQE